MKPTPASGKTIPLIRDLEAGIICGTYAPGGKIPSLRQLMERYNVSMNAARRSVKVLVDKGLLNFSHGAGTYVAEKRRRPAGRWRIAAVAATFGPNVMHTCTGIAVNGILDAADELGIEVTPVPTAFSEMSDARLEAIAADYDGVILLGGYDGILRTPRPPAVVVGLSMHNSCGGLFSLLELDPFRATELAVEFFRKRGVNKVIPVGHDRPVHRVREQLFRDAWKSFGELGEVPDDAMVPPDPAYGIYFTCGGTALAAAEACHAATGRELGSDTPVLCGEGNPLFANRPCREMPTIAINLRQAGIAAAEECLRRLARPGSAGRRIYLLPELYETH